MNLIKEANQLYNQSRFVEVFQKIEILAGILHGKK